MRQTDNEHSVFPESGAGSDSHEPLSEQAGRVVFVVMRGVGLGKDLVSRWADLERASSTHVRCLVLTVYMYIHTYTYRDIYIYKHNMCTFVFGSPASRGADLERLRPERRGRVRSSLGPGVEGIALNIKTVVRQL